MQGIEDLTFSFTTMVQLITLVVVVVSAWAFMNKNFEANRTRLETVEVDLKSNAKEVTIQLDKIANTMDGIHTDLRDQHVELVKIAGTGDLLAQRITAIENQT